MGPVTRHQQARAADAHHQDKSALYSHYMPFVKNGGLSCRRQQLPPRRRGVHAAELMARTKSCGADASSG